MVCPSLRRGTVGGGCCTDSVLRRFSVVTLAKRRGRDATLLVAIAAAMWGLDGLLRKPLATELDAGTVVLWEHLIALIVLAPVVPRALRAFVRIAPRDKLAVVLIGVGSSAVATALFTRAFAISGRTGDFVTPLVLQKLQPLVAIALAVVLLRERPRAIYAAFAVPALAGAWLLTFSDPLHVQVAEAEPALLALGAAALWAAGTVLGRLVSAALQPADITTLRFVFGFLGAAAVGVLFLDSRLDATQWLGFAVVVVSVLALSVHEHRRPPAVVAPALPDER